MQVQLVEHPLARVRLTQMRDEASEAATFRTALHELTLMLVYEATGELATAAERVDTPVGPATGYRLVDPPLLVPVLRAGLGMAEPARTLLPAAQTGFVGLARDEQTLQPVPYLESVPEALSDRAVLVLEPMLATGGSMEHTVRLLADRGAADITAVCAVAAPEGLERLRSGGLPLRVVTAAVDDCLDRSGFIVPGLGDAGDRQFGAG